MAVYLITTPNGERLIEAPNKASAINFVMKSEVKAEALNAVALSKVVREKGLQIEVAEKKDDDGQTDIEDAAAGNTEEQVARFPSRSQSE